jgi:RNA polymerase sigma factor (sigma-70 family)
LPEKQRLAIALKYQEELSSEEISKLIGVPRNTVKTWLLRARENLKKELSGAV